jgi:probable HAF family extracellular repeat protein
MSKLLSGKDTSAATTINNNGTVAGWGRVEGGSARCLVWSSGVVTELGTLGGDYCEAHGSNNIGDVVGQSSLADGNVHTFKLVGSVITKGQCKNFGWQTYDFLNQGRCVSSLVSKKP